MKGLERITQRIQTDAQGQIEALTAAGRRQAQEITEKYEDQARQQLTQLPREKYVHLLVQLAVKNGAGTEEIILSPEDTPLGQQVLEGANAQGRHFRLSAEQRPTGGGLILKQGSVECSCTFPEILRQLRQEMSGEVAAILFD